MGLFSGGFLGGGTDESAKTTNTTTNVTTSTSTSVRDIGVTGKDAVALAQTLGNSAVSIANIGAQQNVHIADLGWGALLKQQDIQKQSQESQTALNLKTLNAEQDVIGSAIQSLNLGYDKLVSSTSDLSNPELSYSKNLIFAVVIIAGIFIFRKGGF